MAPPWAAPAARPAELLGLLLVLLKLGAPGVGDGVDLLAVLGLAVDPAAVFHKLQGRVDGARARRVEAARLVFQLLDHLIAVLGPLGEQGEQLVLQVAAPERARPARP